MKHTINIEPVPSPDEIYIQLSNKENTKEVILKGQKTETELDFKPTKLIIQRKVSIIKRITRSFYCKYVDISSAEGGSESVFYFPIFRSISAAGMTIEEKSGKRNGNLFSAQKWLRRLRNFGCQWKQVEDIKRVFLFPSTKADYISKHWDDDKFFARLFLDGCNPIMIKRCTELPQKIPVKELKAACPDIEELVRKGDIYIVDYELLDKIKEGAINGKQQYLAAPIVLLQEEEDGLTPIAIQLKQDPGDDNPVFTPHDKLAWLLAKIWVRNSDFYLHELVSHLLRTHLLAEVFFLFIYRSLNSKHPILMLFMATGRYTLPINVTARSTLISNTGFFMKYTGLGKDAQKVMLEKANKQVTFESLCLPDNLKSRGLMELKNFCYRDDGLAIWNAIYEFLSSVVDHYYKDDEHLCKDEDLMRLFEDIYNRGFEKKLDFPAEVKTKEEAVKYLTMIMFTCSAQHAAVNHGQYDIYAWMPNGPTTMRQPPPKYKEVVDDQYIMNTLPDLHTTLESMSVSRFLSQVPTDFIPLGQYDSDTTNEPNLREQIKTFQSKLKKIGEDINKREKEIFSYTYLHPDNMENSVAI
ncbi:arachidonate 5-lipoxygenase-like [Arapaima gigas]